LYHNSKKLIEAIEGKGGAMQCVVSGYQQREIHEAAWNQLQAIEDGTSTVVGVNLFQDEEISEFIGQIQDSANASNQSNKIQQVIDNRDSVLATACLQKIREAATDGNNLMEPMIEAYKSDVTLGEVNDVLREVFGTWVAPSGV